MASKDGRFSFRRVALVAAGVFVAVIFILVVAMWDSVSAQYRAFVTLSAVIETPLSPLAEDFTDEPDIEDTTVAGVPTLVAKPGGEGEYPAIVFMNGAVPPGREEPTVNRLAEGLARARYTVYVPDVAGLKSGEISAETVSDTVDVARNVAEDPDTRDGRVAFVGVSAGASLSLLAAAEPSLSGRTTAVTAVAPYTDLENVVRLATTGAYPGEAAYFPDGTPHYLRLVAARSLVSMLPDGEEKESLLRLVPELRHYYAAPPDTTDPLAALPAFALVNDLDPETEAVVSLLTNRESARFDSLYEDLPASMREEILTLSPATEAAEIEAPVEIVTAPRDKYFPPAESEALEGEVLEFRLTVTEAMSHAEPEVSLEDVPAFLELNGFVVRSLENAERRGERRVTNS